MARGHADRRARPSAPRLRRRFEADCRRRPARRIVASGKTRRSGAGHGRQLSGRLRARPDRSPRLLGRGGRGAALAAALGPRARRPAAAVLSLVRRRPAQHLLQCGRPPRRGRPRRPARDHPRQPGHRHGPDAYLQRASGPGRALCRRAAPAGRRSRRSGDHLSADGAGSADRDARVRPDRRDPFGRVRRLRGAGARGPDRRRQAQADRLGQLRHRGRPRDPV